MAQVFSCRYRPPFSGKPNQMKSELHEQARRDDDARDIRRDEARIVHYLKNRGRIIRFKSSLIKSFAAISQRMVHVDERVAIH